MSTLSKILKTIRTLLRLVAALVAVLAFILLVSEPIEPIGLSEFTLLLVGKTILSISMFILAIGMYCLSSKIEEYLKEKKRKQYCADVKKAIRESMRFSQEKRRREWDEFIETHPQYR